MILFELAQFITFTAYELQFVYRVKRLPLRYPFKSDKKVADLKILEKNILKFNF